MEHYGSRFPVEQVATLNAVRNSCAHHGQQGVALRSLLAKCEADGRPLLLGPGVWSLLDDVVVPANVRVIGCGDKTVIKVGSNGLFLLAQASLEHVKLEVSDYYDPRIVGQPALVTLSGTNSKIVSCHLSGSADVHVEIDCLHGLVQDCYSINYGATGISSGGAYARVIGNVVADSGGVSSCIIMGSSYGIASHNVCGVAAAGDLKYLATGNHQVCCNQANEVSYP